MKRAERNALRRREANARRRIPYVRGVDVDAMAHRLMRTAYLAAQEGRIAHSMLPDVRVLVGETLTATTNVTDPVEVLLIGVREVFSGWSNAAARERATCFLAERAFGWHVNDGGGVMPAWFNGAAAGFVERQLPVHRALAVVCKESGYPRLSMRQMKCLGSVLNHRFLRNHLDRQLVGPEVPSVLEAIAAAGLTVTDKIYPELLVPPPEWFDMHEKMGEDAA